MLRDRDWRIAPRSLRRYAWRLDLPPPSLPGAFQFDNAGIAHCGNACVRPTDGCHRRRARGVAGAATAPPRQTGGAVAGGLGAMARRRTQSRRRRRAGRASANMVGSAGACGCRHEADKGCHRVPPAIGSICNHACGRWPNLGSTMREQSRRSLKSRAALRGRVRNVCGRVARAAARSDRSGVDMRQPLPGGRGAEAGCLMPSPDRIGIASSRRSWQT